MQNHFFEEVIKHKEKQLKKIELGCKALAWAAGISYVYPDEDLQAEVCSPFKYSERHVVLWRIDQNGNKEYWPFILIPVKELE